MLGCNGPDQDTHGSDKQRRGSQAHQAPEPALPQQVLPLLPVVQQLLFHGEPQVLRHEEEEAVEAEQLGAHVGRRRVAHLLQQGVQGGVPRAVAQAGRGAVPQQQQQALGPHQLAGQVQGRLAALHAAAAPAVQVGGPLGRREGLHGLEDAEEDADAVVADGHGQVRGRGLAAAEALAGHGQRALRELSEQVPGVGLVVVHQGVQQRLGGRVEAHLAPVLPVEDLHGPHVLQEPDGQQVAHRLVEGEGRFLALLLRLGARAADPPHAPRHGGELPPGPASRDRIGTDLRERSAVRSRAAGAASLHPGERNRPRPRCSGTRRLLSLPPSLRPPQRGTPSCRLPVPGSAPHSPRR